jgi:predicted amidohydrolase
VGEDGTGITYSGDSAVFGPVGEPLIPPFQHTGAQTIVLQKEPLTEARNQFPFLKDADAFLIR